jgi:GNAT superfamily N-acetyltransferase
MDEDNDDVRNALRIARNTSSSVDSPSAKFMNEYKEDTWDHPLDSRTRLLNTKTGLDPRDDFATLELSKYGDNGVHVHSIMALEKGRGQGRQALQYLTNLADKHGVDLHGSAKAFGRSSGLNTTKLKAWYRRNGFQVDRSGDMIRKPAKGAN